MEAEDDDFGELYYDVLKPFTLQSPKIKLAEKNPTVIDNGRGLQNVEKGKEVVGTVRLEIYLGSRRVLENKFVFSLDSHEPGQVGQAENDSGFNHYGNVATDDQGNEMNSVQRLANHSQCERFEKIVACDARHELNSDHELIHDSSQCDQPGRAGMVEVGDSNSDPGPDGINGRRIPEGEFNLTNKRIDRTSSVEMHEIFVSSEPCRREPSEEGQLSEYAEQFSNREIVNMGRIPSNSEEEARNGYNKVQYPPYKSPLKNMGHIAGTPFGQAVVPHYATTSKAYRRQPKTRFPNLSSSLFDQDMESFEPKPWRNPNVDISDYFNFGLDGASWKTYCEEFKTMRRHMGKPILVQHGVRDPCPSVKALPQRQRDSTSTIQIVAQDKPYAFTQREQIKLCGRPELEKNGGPSRSQQGKQNIHQTIFDGVKGEQANKTELYNNDEGSKRAKIMEETSRDSSSNMSDNEWMCRHVGTDSWFHPISLPEKQRKIHQETNRKGSKKGRSKLERWTRHDRDNDDENTSTSSQSSPLDSKMMELS